LWRSNRSKLKHLQFIKNIDRAHEGPPFHLILSEHKGNNILKTASSSEATNYQKPISIQTMALAALAILGHKSAHSLPMGPVMADPTSSKTATISNMNHCRNITAKTRVTPIPAYDSHEGIINNSQAQANNTFQKNIEIGNNSLFEHKTIMIRHLTTY
jgi:hypothetical protein